MLNARFFDYRDARLAPYELFLDLLRTAVINCSRRTARRCATPSKQRAGVRLLAELFEESNRGDATNAGVERRDFPVFGAYRKRAEEERQQEERPETQIHAPGNLDDARYPPRN